MRSISKRHDLKADFAFICSNSGFTKGALRKARRKGITPVSILSAGDDRIKLVISKEIYFRKDIQIDPIEHTYFISGALQPIRSILARLDTKGCQLIIGWSKKRYYCNCCVQSYDIRANDCDLLPEATI